MTVKIFLAHATEDKPRVRALYHELKARKFQPWLDAEDILPGDNWRETIPQVIATTDLFLLCLSKTSVAKRAGYVNLETRLAMTTLASRPPGQVFLIPVLLEECQVPPFQLPELGIKLADFHCARLYEDAGFEMLLRSIERVAARQVSSDESETVHMKGGAELVILRQTPSATNGPPKTQHLFWNVPSRNHYFTGRDDILKELRSRLVKAKGAALNQVVKGLGGIGKTQTAVEYAHRFKPTAGGNRKVYDHVLWIPSASETLLRGAYVELARELKLPGCNEAVSVR